MIGTNIRHLKITLGMDVLKRKTLDGVRKERLIFLLVYNLIRIIMLQAVRRQGVNVNRLSFADTLAWIRHGDLHHCPPLIVNPLTFRPIGTACTQTPQKAVPLYDQTTGRTQSTTL